MRITGGQWRGRTLLMPKSDAVRPTQDRVREALFGLLQPVLPGATFLDLFAGSGAVGLEALSRGALFADLAFGVGPHHARNTDTLRLLGVAADAPEAPRRPLPLALPSATIVFADPPYLWAKENGFGELAKALVAHGLPEPGGFLVAEFDHRTDPEPLPGFTLLRDRAYGKTRLAIWRRDA